MQIQFKKAYENYTKDVRRFSQDVRKMFVGISLDVRWMFAGCPLYVRRGSLDVPSMPLGISQHVRRITHGGPWISSDVHSMFGGCSQDVRWDFVGCPLDVCWLPVGCPSGFVGFSFDATLVFATRSLD